MKIIKVILLILISNFVAAASGKSSCNPKSECLNEANKIPNKLNGTVAVHPNRKIKFIDFYKLDFLGADYRFDEAKYHFLNTPNTFKFNLIESEKTYSIYPEYSLERNDEFEKKRTLFLALEFRVPFF